jgi:hypothetical protein
MIQRGCPPLSPRRLALIAPPGSFPAAIGGIPEQVVSFFKLDFDYDGIGASR